MYDGEWSGKPRDLCSSQLNCPKSESGWKRTVVTSRERNAGRDQRGRARERHGVHALRRLRTLLRGRQAHEQFHTHTRLSQRVCASGLSVLFEKNVLSLSRTRRFRRRSRAEPCVATRVRAARVRARQHGPDALRLAPGALRARRAHRGLPRARPGVRENARSSAWKRAPNTPTFCSIQI